MAGSISNANRFGRDPQRRITAATAVGMYVLKPIMHLSGLNAADVGRQCREVRGQLRKGVEETATTVEEQLDNRRARVN